MRHVQANVSSEVSENIRLRKGIIDCGATATLDSVCAVEALMTDEEQCPEQGT